MRKTRFTLAAFLTLALVSFRIAAQDSPKPDSRKPATTLKVLVTFTENEGDKKLASLPYTFFLKAADAGPNSPWTKLRMGSRVPVNNAKDGGLQYIDVGTNVDARAVATEDGKFDITLNLERSWVEHDALVRAEKTGGADDDANSGHNKPPVIHQFKTEITLTMRDGQTIQTTQAADPVSGRVLTITLAVNIVK
jgi:hypothetical protein